MSKIKTVFLYTLCLVATIAATMFFLKAMDLIIDKLVYVYH